jgi:HAD superfamily hydrolase (TIGR01509 family)
MRLSCRRGHADGCAGFCFATKRRPSAAVPAATCCRSVSETPVRAIVLDFNGTLAQDDHLVAPLYVDTFASVGVRLTVEQYHRELAAMPDRDAVDLLVSRAGLPCDATGRDALVEALADGYLAAVAEKPPITDHAIAFVRAASAYVPLAITSGAFRRAIDHVLHAAGLAEHFQVVVSIDDVSNGKPDPEGFRHALAQLNAITGADPAIEPQQTVAVEDATGGAEAARAAGMRVAAIRGPGYDASSGYADVVIDRLDPAALELILGRGCTPG